MAPRWFKNVNFDRILSQIPAQHYDGADRIREKLAQLDFPSFNSTGPIITEVESDNDENHVPDGTLAIHSSSAKSSFDQIFADYSGLPAPERPDSPDSVRSVISTQSSVSARSSVSSQLSAPGRSIELFLNDLQDELSVEVQSVDESAHQPTTNNVSSRVSQSRLINEEPIEVEASHLRRSKRKRCAPLDFARGERPIYKRAGPTFELVGVEKGFPERYIYGRRRNPIQRPRRPKNAVVHKPTEFKAAKKGGFLYHSESYGSHHSLISGLISLEPNQVKPHIRSSVKSIYLFLVRSGEVFFKFSNDKSTETFVANSKTPWLDLKPGYGYEMKNIGTKKAEIAYIVSDRVQE